MPRKTSSRPRLVIKSAKRRTTYAHRTGQTSRATVTLVAALKDQHWDHDMIRQALLRQAVVTLDELTDELPRPAISHAVTKGWLYRQPHEDWLRVTKRAAAELELPRKTGAGTTIRFFDAAKLAPSAPAFPEVKKAEVSPARAAELVARVQAMVGPLAAAKLYQAVLDETGWAPAELARRIAGDDQKAMRAWWDRIIWRTNLLTLEPVYQAAADAGTLSDRVSGELYRVPAAKRAQLWAAIQSGEVKSFKAIRDLASSLI